MDDNTPNIEIAIGREFPKKVTPLIKAAKKSINIIIYDWRWYPDQIGTQIQIFNNALINAHHRGVKINAVVNHAPMYEMLKGLGIKAKINLTSKKLHAKLMLIDDEITILGSHNYTKTAFDINYEASIIVHDSEVALDFKYYFDNFFV